MPPIIHGSLPIIHGSQRKSRPRSLAQAEGRAVRQRSKRVRTGAKAKTAGSEQTPPSISEEGRDIQYPEQQAEAVATTLRRRTDLARPSAPMVADGPAASNPSDHEHVSSKRTSTRQASEVPASLRATRKSTRIANMQPQKDCKTTNMAADRRETRRDVDIERLGRAQDAEKEAQAKYDEGVNTENAKVEEVIMAAAAVVDRLKQRLQSAKANTAHARDVVQRKLARQHGHQDGDAHDTDDDDSDTSE